MTIFENINRLVSYALMTSLIHEEDIVYTQNRLLELFKLDGFDTAISPVLPEVQIDDLESILGEMLEYAGQKGQSQTKEPLFKDTGINSRDLFDTKIMGLLVSPPSVIQNTFFNLLKTDGPETATNWYYKFSCDTDYIRRYRINKDLKWKTSTEYGDLDITINLSKPEKDPKAIAAARNFKATSYPACLLCKENEGYAGRMNHAARQNHRIIPVTLNGEKWFMQYSPYVYYNEHCIVFDAQHEPMKICRDTFVRLIDFIKIFPHYTLGSNADIPIVGGSILSHNHFQGGRYSFPMENAPIEKYFQLQNYPTVQAGIVKWPMSVIRLTSKDDSELIEAASYILETWKSYSDEEAFIFAETNGEKHNTITPIARRRGQSKLFELDLVLRNNITTEEHPLGVFHPHANLHHIKKENIGLIEVMGLAVLPSRLKQELLDLEKAINDKLDLSQDKDLCKHAEWINEIQKQKGQSQSIDQTILKHEVGLIFKQVLEDAGVFKRTEAGRLYFQRFINRLVKL